MLKEFNIGDHVVLCRKNWNGCDVIWHCIMTIDNIKPSVSSGIAARCITPDGNIGWANTSELVKVPNVGDKVTVYKPNDGEKFPFWDEAMDYLDGTKVEVCSECKMQEDNDGNKYPVFKDMDGYSFSVFWLIPPEGIQKKNDNPLFCSCDVPVSKIVDYSIGGSKKEYVFCTLCKKEYLPF